MSKAITPITNHHVDHRRQTHWVWHAIPQAKDSHFTLREVCIARQPETEYYVPDPGTIHLNEEAAKKLRDDLSNYIDQCDQARFENVQRLEQQRWDHAPAKYDATLALSAAQLREGAGGESREPRDPGDMGDNSP